MAGQQRRSEEVAALAALRALENVTEYEWLTAGRADGVRTPDLKLVLGDAREVVAEITMATNRPDNELRGAARRMWPIRSRSLSREWTVHVSDHDIATRSRRRTLKDLVAAMIPVLADVEERGGTAEEMQLHANRILDPDPYNPYVSQSVWFAAEWQAAQPWDGPFKDWTREHLAQQCGYWYPADIVDCVADSLEPRRVSVLKPPAPTQDTYGGVYVATASIEPGFLLEDVGYLVPEVQAAINHKHERGQTKGAPADKWLVVALDGGNAAAQFDACFRPEQQQPCPDLGDALDLLSFDEVWILAKTFHGRRCVVLRLSNSGDEPQSCTIEIP
ncbi:MAG: hypothetical protein F4144_13325 [Acidimicrobiaceae bacterium]|nr:hypothetical protein [Acidobacteriota bacterium]MYH00449.1 hypothetical protein [Acidimicrobiaceae bacterium]